MKKITKLVAMLLAMVMAVGMLSACGGSGDPGTSAAGGDQTTEAGSEQNESQEATQGGATGEGPQYGGHLDVRVASTIQGIDPLKQTGAWRYIYETCVFQNPLTRDAENKIAPGVCDYELSDDMLTLTMWVVDGKTFSNGNPVTIQDVEASINRAFKLYSNIAKKVVPNVESVTVDGDRLTVKFNKYSNACLKYFAAYQTWMAVMPKEICEKYNDKYIIDQCEDAIGTGPYYFSDFRDNVQVTITKHDNYTPVETDRSGLAGTQYGYLDSITFWFNNSDESTALALLSGEYDVCEVIPAEYEPMAYAQGLKAEVLKSNSTTFCIFNTKGSNLCAKYPALRKAIMAAIDYEDFLGVVTDNQQLMNSNLLLRDEFENGKFTAADYYGPANQEVVDKYMAEAKAQGYDDQPIQFVFNSRTNTIATLMGDYLDKAGINYQISAMEANAFQTFVNDDGNNWDYYFTWLNTGFYPSDMDTAITEKHYGNTEKDKLMEQMLMVDYDDPQYLEMWDSLSDMFVEDCAFGFMSRINWFWWGPETFHANDDDSYQRTMVNAYWEDPQNHMD
ncbi:MAG: hypothetical protein IJS22_02530 [Lachnospiraceae bacterium]|nr:hypothetical protein [Lachnospiraceae bacterium]